MSREPHPADCPTCLQPWKKLRPKNALRRLVFDALEYAHKHQSVGVARHTWQHDIREFERFRAYCLVAIRWCEESFVEAPPDGWDDASIRVAMSMGKAVKGHKKDVFFAITADRTSVRIRTAKSIADNAINKGELEFVAEEIFDLIVQKIVPGCSVTDFVHGERNKELLDLARERDLLQQSARRNKTELVSV